MTELLVPAEQLLGMELQNGWKVVEHLERGPKASGGNFSKGYVVKHSTGRMGFLKALDYSAAFDHPDPPAALKELNDAYVYEREILYKCEAKKMTRVATPLADGTIEVPNAGPLRKVPYIIFEIAAGDSRRQLDMIEQFEVGWRLRSLHNVTIGLSQLHQRSIAHQDLKPSNILVYDSDISKVADLGRSSENGNPSPFEDWQFPGDWGYAPPELAYGYIDPDWKKRRIGTDVYMLGSMILFFFTRVSMSPAIFSRLDVAYLPTMYGGTFGGTFEDVLPFLKASWDEVLQEFERDIRRFHAAPGLSLLEMITQLTDPDPSHRGHPKDKRINQYSLQRYISLLNLVCERHRIKGRK